MQKVKSIARGFFNLIARSNPERLWMHYAIALLIIFGLLFATHLVNRTIIERSSAAAALTKASNSQVLLGYEILSLAEAATLKETANFQDLTKATKEFQYIHSQIISDAIWSDDLHALYFGDANPLHRTIREFAQLAKRLEDAPPELQPMILARMKSQFMQRGLKDRLLTAGRMIGRETGAEVARLSQLQKSLLTASLLLLVIEVLVIFLPAQFIVRSNIRQLRNQGDILRNSEAKLQEANGQLEHLINHDTLTGLPNRSSLMTHLKQVLADPNAPDLAVLFVGLDEFKSINDSAGHDFGDDVLIAVGQVLKSCVDEDHFVARVGGDEFVVITDEPSDVLVKRIRASLADPLEIRGKRLPISMSIGFLDVERDYQQPLAVMADVGLALQCAKNLGENGVQRFQQSLRDEIGSKRLLQLELVDAIRNGEIEPWFQPQMRLSDGRLHGAEVLARWQHPTRGLLTPDKFLPAAELSGLMIDIDHCVWRSAMTYARQWQSANLWRPCISLNAAPDTIADPYLIERFLLELQNSGLEADQIIIEVLETTLIHGKDDMAAINIDSLAECGIALELDDFGTGYASLSKLTQLPLSGIKLDRTLVAPLPDASADSIVRAILALATELGLHVIAEGIEESGQAQHLNERGCSFGQGYGYARPMPPAEFHDWLILNANQQVHVGSGQLLDAKRA